MADSSGKMLVPPNSKESEMMVLGCMLTSINALNTSASKLDESDFYFSEHKIIFMSLQDAFNDDRSTDIHLLAEDLKKKDQLKSIGGPAYLMTLAQYAGTSAHIDEYCDIVLHKSILRRMIQASQKIEKEALGEPDDVHGALDDAQQKFFVIGQRSNSQSGLHIKDVLRGVKTKSEQPFLKELQERQERYQTLGPSETKVTGIPTLFTDLDKMLNGFENSNMIVLGCRPAMGKTALALNLAENICFKNDIPVGIFSLEMSAEQLVHRMICSQAEVESEKIKTGSLNGTEYQRIVQTVGEMNNHTMVIDDQPGLKITEIRARARRMVEAYGVGFIVIDYLQLIYGSGTKQSSDSRQNEIAEISRMIKNLARELQVPILCCAQLSRKVDERVGHRPMMSDLRESGSIEQDADQILFLLRQDYYDPMNKPGMATVIIGKNRHGSVGDVTLHFRKEIGQFANYSPLEPVGAPAGEEYSFDN